jgi:hypothetical protein
MWFKEMEIAIIEKDTDKLQDLLNAPLEFKNIQDVNRAMCLLEEALGLLCRLKSETAQTMAQLKRNIEFLKSTQAPPSNMFDVIS